jgi:hypothetical protein
MMEFRYEDDGEEYMLYRYSSNESQPRGSITGRIDTYPAWLQRILDVAKIAGVINVKHPPPVRLLWFVTDDEYNLVEFTKL